MTFAKMGQELCDCDECGPLSIEISSAVAEHKRQKMLLNDFSKTIVQERSLVKRHDGLSIWKLVLPPGADPLREYGSSHRIIFVERFPRDRIVKSIGKGIIGSSNEEKSRMVEHWQERCAYFYGSNGGKAIGWVNDKLDSDKNLDVSDVTNDVVLYVVKVTHDLLDRMNKKEITFVKENDETELSINMNEFPHWVGEMLNVFKKTLDTRENNNSDSTNNAPLSTRVDIPRHGATRLRIMIDPFIKETAS